MTDDSLRHEQYYRGAINYESILGNQITRVAVFRDTNIKQYASSIETLIFMCPKAIRNTAIKKRDELKLSSCEYDSITPDRMKLYDGLWRFVNEELENRDLIFKTKTFEIGSEE